jgi:uncharacterized protein YndB with AHSA1/START domain
MKTEIKTDLEQATFLATREFKAEISIVWRYFTDSDLLDQWWAPAPWKCETKMMDFKEGGKWVYDMVGPEGERHGGIQLYETIDFENFFSGKDAFADQEGKIDESLPACTWKNSFTTTEKGTLLVSEAQYPTTEALRTVLEMGMSEGLAMGHDQLDLLLTK